MVDPSLVYPDFTLQAYQHLLEAMAKRWRIAPLETATERAGRGELWLRHDVDFSPALALAMAEIEGGLGVQATYFVALHLHYNPHTPLHARALQRIAALGHAVGLHYDGSVYDSAASPAARLTMLEQHVAVLHDICQVPIRTIARHNPSVAGGDDPFAVATPYLNAYDPRLFQDTVYLSDSCRAWRNGGLSACWSDAPPPRIYLLIHPELWGDRAGVARLAFLSLLHQQVVQEQDDFFADVQEIWQCHVGGLEHDLRSATEERPLSLRMAEGTAP